MLIRLLSGTTAGRFLSHLTFVDRRFGWRRVPVLFLFVLAAGNCIAVSAAVTYTGVNLAGAEFGSGHVPGTYGTDYIYPTQTEVDYFRNQGMNIVRLPFLWERLQRALNASLDANELSRLQGFVKPATAKGCFVILDPHNYARYNGSLIGSAAVPAAAFTNFWSRVSGIFRTNDHVVFGLMNEPYGMATEAWRDAANLAIRAIRDSGATNLILVPGNAWTGAHSWFDSWYGTPNATAMLAITDPGNNYAFEVHQYLNSDSSGGTADCVSSTIGSQRLVNFTSWCRTNRRRGFLGEFGASTNSPCLQTLNDMLAYVDANADVWLGWTYWSAGPWWGEYMFTVEPVNGTNRPQMNVLEAYVPLPTPTLKVISPSAFQYLAQRGYVYQALASSNLVATTWTNYLPAVTGLAQTITVPLHSRSNASVFYRVRASRAP